MKSYVRKALTIERHAWIAVLITAAALVAATGCGDSSDTADGEAREAAAETTSTPAAAGSRGQSGDTASRDAAHSHGDAGTHTHGGDTHTHSTADTLDAAVPIEAAGDGSTAGTVTVLARGDTLRLHVALDGAEPGTRHPVQLLEGSCAGPGESLAELTPVMTGTSGSGSSQTDISSARTAGHAHGAVTVRGASGGTVGCAAVHLGGAHEHQ